MDQPFKVSLNRGGHRHHAAITNKANAVYTTAKTHAGALKNIT